MATYRSWLRPTLAPLGRLGGIETVHAPTRHPSAPVALLLLGPGPGSVVVVVLVIAASLVSVPR